MEEIKSAMKRIGVVIREKDDLDTCKRRLADAQVAIINARIEQNGYASIHVEDEYLDMAILVLREGGLDLAEV